MLRGEIEEVRKVNRQGLAESFEPNSETVETSLLDDADKIDDFLSLS